MRPDDIETIRQFVHARSGVVIDPTKTYSIETRLAPVARREGFATIEDLIAAIRERREDRLIWAAAEALVAGESSFFRDHAPFEAFRDEILPALAQSRQGRPIKVWSAACGTGQEPYSLAMILDDERSKLQGAKVELFGSDISERALEKAQSGTYSQFEVQRGLPIRLLVRHFDKTDEAWTLNPRIRQAVRWRRINLLADLRALGQFDVIFCRNAISAFDGPTRRRVLEQLARALPDDGWLVLGLDETVVGVTEAFRAAPGRRGLYTPN
ncbi:MAG TPA: protein-glutamate O-methyltransferase CheR, partial [Caulobacteraceae bacterium]|nr:protein-glutamate O-methyltransferase CheR [Caulobacteraceae bacterium]